MSELLAVVDQRRRVREIDVSSCGKPAPAVPLSLKREIVLHRFGPEIVCEQDARVRAYPRDAIDVARLFSNHDGLTRPDLSAYTGGRMAYHAVLNTHAGALLLALPCNAKGAHAEDHNSTGYGLAVLHDWRSSCIDARGMSLLLQAIEWIQLEFELMINRRLALVSHDEVRDKPKPCPGRYLDMDALRAVAGAKKE